MSPTKTNSPTPSETNALSVVENGTSSMVPNFAGLSEELKRPAMALAQVHNAVGEMAVILKKYSEEVVIFAEQHGKMQEKDEEIKALEATIRGIMRLKKD